MHTLRRASALNAHLPTVVLVLSAERDFMKKKKKNIIILEDNPTDEERKKRELDALLFGELVFPKIETPKGYVTLRDLNGEACCQISTKKIPF